MERPSEDQPRDRFARGIAALTAGKPDWPALVSLAFMSATQAGRDILRQIWDSPEQGLMALGIPMDQADAYGFGVNDPLVSVHWITTVATVVADLPALLDDLHPRYQPPQGNPPQ